MNFQLLAMALATALASISSDDGCYVPIRGVSVLSIQGSAGYSASCTTAETTVAPTEAPVETTEASEYTEALLLHEKRHSGLHPFARKLRTNRGPFQRHLSLLEREEAVDDSVKTVCMTASEEADLGAVPYAEFSLDAQYVIRGFAFTAGPATYYEPTSYTLNGRSDQTAAVAWYASQTDADSGTPWTSVSGSVGPLDVDFSGVYFQIFPKSPTSTVSGTAFSVQLLGCAVSQTAMISFRFKSSKSAISARFGKLSTFVTSLTEHVCLMTKLTRTPQACGRIVFAELQETTEVNSVDGGTPIQPSKVPNVEVYFRVLPPNLSTCTDCRDAATVQSNLLTDLSTSTSAGAALLRAIDTWIEDADPYMCYQKTCPSGSLCVSGVCATPSEIAVTEAEGTSMESKFTSAADIDQILNLSPLNVIEGVDQTAGALSFSGTPKVAGTMQTDATAPATPTTSSSEESFIQRFFIPILAISIVAGLLLVLIGYRFWARSRLPSGVPAAPTA